ncbi:flagellar assembly protein FliH [Bacillus sp. B1-b2]|nr:flagellar assembly protein FliH [Bacillus sp. B1-b2]
MILLSRIFKSAWANQPDTNQKVINIRYIDTVNDDFRKSQELSYQEYQDIIAKAHQEAEQIKQQAMYELEQANEQVGLMYSNWETEKLELMEQARTEGFHSGFEEGRNQAYQEASVFIKEAKESIVAAKNDYNNYLQSAESTILNLAIQVSEKIIHHSIEKDEKYFLHLVENALRDVRKQREIQLHVHPSHYPMILGEKEELLQLFPAPPNLFIFPDESLPENGCLIETANGQLDASIDTQLTIVKEKLLEILESE